MAKTQDFTKMMQDMMASMPMDMSKMQDAFKAQTVLTEKMAKVALDAAEKSTDISAKWAKDSLAKVGALTASKAEPADYAKVMSDFASASVEMATENLAAFAEVAKKVQMDTVELMLAAGKELTEETTAAVKKATDEVTAAAKKTVAAK